MEDITPQEKLRLCLLKLLNVNKLKFFGYTAYNFNFKIQKINSSQTNEEKIDSILNYNKSINKFELIFSEDYLNENSISCILHNILHNVLHLLSQHNARINTRDKHLFEIAADHVVNLELKKSIYRHELPDIDEPPNCTIIEELKYENYTVEEVYEYLLNRAQQQSKNQQSGENNPNNLFENLEIATYRVDNQEITNVDNLKSVTTIQATTKLNEIKSSANLLLKQDSIARGLESGSLFEFLQKITKVEIPWDKLLEKAILCNIAPNPDTRTWINPKKRFRAHNILLPGPGIDKSLDTLVVCIDTSGSISNKDLQKFAGIIINSLTKFKKVWLLKHDTKIRQNVILDANKIDAEQIISKMEGRGGTSHTAVYEIIENAFLKKELKMGLILFLTDFMSNVEEIYKNYEWPKIIPVVHLINATKYMLSRVPQDLDKNPILLDNIKEV